MTFYSPNTKGFYISDIHKDIPSDAIEISDSYRQQLIDAQSQGKVIHFDGVIVQAVEPDSLLTQEELLAKAKSLKEQEIRTAYNNACQIVVSVNGISYDGGFDSAIKLDAAKRLSETAGLTEVTFYSSNNEAQTLTLADATTVIMMIAQDFQTKLTKKQMLMVQNANAATIEEVALITWGSN